MSLGEVDRRAGRIRVKARTSVNYTRHGLPTFLAVSWRDLDHGVKLLQVDRRLLDSDSSNLIFLIRLTQFLIRVSLSS